MVAKIVLLIPHSNTGIERAYSFVNKNKEEGSERNRVGIDGSLPSILAVKMGLPKGCSECNASIGKRTIE